MLLPHGLHLCAEACDRVLDRVRVLLPAFVQLSKHGLGIRTIDPAHLERLQQLNRRAVGVVLHHVCDYAEIGRILRNRAVITERQPQHRAAVRQLHALHADGHLAVVPAVGQTHLGIVLAAGFADPLAAHKMQHIFGTGFGRGQVGVFERGRLCRHLA